MRRISIIANGVIAAIALGFASHAGAESPSVIKAQVEEALTEFYAQDATHRELAGKASAMLIFPRVTKAGAGVGGEYGEGALEVNGSTVGYYKMTGASIGATLGAAHRSEVILFMTNEAREKFLKSNGWTIGADANVAVVKGAGTGIDTQTMQHPVLAFVFGEKGLIADVSLEGAKVTKLKE